MKRTNNVYSLIIIGAGEYGQLVKELAELQGYEKIAFLDDNSELAIGKTADYQKYTKEYTDFIVAIGNPTVRRRVVEMMEPYFTLATIIHPTAVISKSAQIEKGCVIEAHTVVNTGAKVGKACLINAGSVINHNSRVSDYCQVDCNAVIAADTIVLEYTKVTSCSVWNEK